MGNIENTEQFVTGEKGEKEFATWLEEVRGYIPGKDFIHYDWETHSKEQREHKDFWVKGVTVDVKWTRSVFRHSDINIEYKQVKRSTEVFVNCYGKQESKYVYKTVEGNWLDNAQCDYLVYGDMIFRKFYVIDVKKLREYIYKYKTDKNRITSHMAPLGDLFTYFYSIPYSILEGERIILGEICLGSK